ncbi:hypothetical protein [Dongia sp.]
MMFAQQKIGMATTGLWLGWHARVLLPDLPPSGPLERGDIER